MMDSANQQVIAERYPPRSARSASVTPPSRPSGAHPLPGLAAERPSPEHDVHAAQGRADEAYRAASASCPTRGGARNECDEDTVSPGSRAPEEDSAGGSAVLRRRIRFVHRQPRPDRREHVRQHAPTGAATKPGDVCTINGRRGRLNECLECIPDRQRLNSMDARDAMLQKCHGADGQSMPNSNRIRDGLPRDVSTNCARMEEVMRERQHQHVPPPPPAIDERIASALGVSDMSAADLTALIAEAEPAAADADATAEPLPPGCARPREAGRHRRRRCRSCSGEPDARPPARRHSAAASAARRGAVARVCGALGSCSSPRRRSSATPPRHYCAIDTRRWSTKSSRSCSSWPPPTPRSRRSTLRLPPVRSVASTASSVTCAAALMQPDVWIAEQLRLPVLDRKGGSVYAWPPSQHVSAAAPPPSPSLQQARQLSSPGRELAGRPRARGGAPPRGSAAGVCILRAAAPRERGPEGRGEQEVARWNDAARSRRAREQGSRPPLSSWAGAVPGPLLRLRRSSRECLQQPRQLAAEPHLGAASRRDPLPEIAWEAAVSSRLIHPAGRPRSLLSGRRTGRGPFSLAAWRATSCADAAMPRQLFPILPRKPDVAHTRQIRRV